MSGPPNLSAFDPKDRFGDERDSNNNISSEKSAKTSKSLASSRSLFGKGQGAIFKNININNTKLPLNLKSERNADPPLQSYQSV